MNDFTGFTFNHIHSKDLHLVVVSSSNRYEKNLLPPNKDYTMEVPGGNGDYYFGSTFSKREFTVQVAFDKVDEKTWRRIANLFATDKLCDLIFDELPYKTWRAKLANKPEFKFICFTDRDTCERVYKGEGTLTFVCYFPFAFGFNKYIIRAADRYLMNMPDPEPVDKGIHVNPYRKKEKGKLNFDTKEFYKVENNMNTPWKGGYPTIEQVQAGELFFKDENGNDKIIDVRDYFRNVPEWAPSSKLLVTPTLDYDQDLIYLPQYTKLNYINMDTGLNNENALIGSRLLVYNPGDIPIDFELKMNNVLRTFHDVRGKHFQVRRFNVHRLPIPMAVDLTGLKVEEHENNEQFKYGKRYFKILKGQKVEGDITYNAPVYEKLTENECPEERINTNSNISPWKQPAHHRLDKHPNHAFIAEPIPLRKLGHYIKLFYWQSGNLNFEKGIEIANRYEEMLELCIDDYECYELYWNTLKEAILNKYTVPTGENKDEFIYNYIHNPPEFIRRNNNLDYREIKFNTGLMPTWITEDYLDITTENIESNTIFLDSSKQMLYNIINPKVSASMFDYKPSKVILNDNIKQGHWFKIPPGWSLIEVTPVCDEDIWGGKRWLDSRPFVYGGDPVNLEHNPVTKLFNKIYDVAATDYKQRINKSDLMFRHWYDDKIQSCTGFDLEYYQTKIINYEYGFLKTLHNYWRLQKGITIDGVKIKGTIDEWWWYANHYLWEHFPPLYWGFSDILNDAQIKYTPLFY